MEYKYNIYVPYIIFILFFFFKKYIRNNKNNNENNNKIYIKRNEKIVYKYSTVNNSNKAYKYFK